MKRRSAHSLRGLLAAAAVLAGGSFARADGGPPNIPAPSDLPAASASGGSAAPADAARPLGRGNFSSAHGQIQAIPEGYRCAFAQAPLPEAVADIARAWGVPVAYFGSPSRRTSAAFAAPTAAAALLELADRTDLQLAPCGGGWCLEDARGEAAPPPLAAPWAAGPAPHP